MIYDEVLSQAQKQGVALDKSSLEFSPRRSGTKIIASRRLSEKDKACLLRVVEETSRHYPNRKVQLELR